ncbi:MAG: cytochrome c biogenesis protein CcdA [bacterium]|nr:cytochrome c biogenesis protein CcdA [bacterium]
MAMATISAQDLINLSLFTQLGIVFVAGILTSLTPCVYPLIPITLAVFGAREQSSKFKSFLLSFTYVLGIATTYTALGLISSLTGSFFGGFLSNPYISLLIGITLILAALSSLDVCKFNFGQAAQTKANKIGGKGFFGAYLMGLVSGIIAAPCTGPILASILIVAGSSGSPFLGSVLLFTHALGLGLIFILLGTFSGLIKTIPKSGNWLYTLKYFMAVAIFLVALFFLTPALKSMGLSWNQLSISILTIFVSIIVGIKAMKENHKLLKIFSSLLLALTLFSLPSVYENSTKNSEIHFTDKNSELIWHNNIEDGIAEAKLKNSIIMVDLYADWCQACKEYEKITFKDPLVVKTLSQISLVRIDFTVPSDLSSALEDKYNLLGLPTILFLNADASEIQDSRITGFYEAEEFLMLVKKLLPH